MNAAGDYRAYVRQLQAEKRRDERRRRAKANAQGAQRTAYATAERVVEKLNARGFPVETWGVAAHGTLVEVTFLWPDLERHFVVAMRTKDATPDVFGDAYRRALQDAGVR